MTRIPKIEAKRLVDKFWGKGITNEKDIAKKCALMCVNELIIQNGELYLNLLGDKTNAYYREVNAYLFDVESEIEEL
jgi:hypothetical protein